MLLPLNQHLEMRALVSNPIQPLRKLAAMLSPVAYIALASVFFGSCGCISRQAKDNETNQQHGLRHGVDLAGWSSSPTGLAFLRDTVLPAFDAAHIHYFWQVSFGIVDI